MRSSLFKSIYQLFLSDKKHYCPFSKISKRSNRSVGYFAILSKWPNRTFKPFSIEYILPRYYFHSQASYKIPQNPETNF